MKRIILFGAGRYLEDRKNQVLSLPDTEILYIFDNSEDIVSDFYGIPIRHFLGKIDDEYDYVVITATYAEEIRNQLISLNVEPERILRLKEYIGRLFDRKWEQYNVDDDILPRLCKDESIVVIDWTGDFNGACLAAIYMLMELKTVGYKVGFAAPSAKQEFIDYAVSQGINVCIYPNIEFTCYDDFEWIHQFKTVFVNTLLPHKCIQNLKYERIIWWIHESESAYINEERMWGKFIQSVYRNADIYCVSDVSINTFHRFFPDIHVKRLEYGVPDFYKQNANASKNKNKKIVFAIIGNGYSGKGQDILASAIRKLSSDALSRCEFWVIGELSDKNYCRKLKQNTKGYPVKYYGKLTHKEIIEMYPQIDVLISASREDSLPIAITEAFMNKKIAIISDVIGTINYVDNNKNAFVFENENSDELAYIIGRVIDDFENLADIGEAGRKVYDKYFSMESFRKRLNSIMGERHA